MSCLVADAPVVIFSRKAQLRKQKVPFSTIDYNATRTKIRYKNLTSHSHLSYMVDDDRSKLENS
jgi:hypothetical protein